MLTLSTVRDGLADAVVQASRRLNVPRIHLRDDIGFITDRDMIRHYRETGTLLVWTGMSSNTLFGQPSDNYLFRAWHDYCHILSQVCNREHGKLGCFEPRAEYDVADWQCNGIGDRLAAVVQTEIRDGAKVYEDTGLFIPENQIEWALPTLERRWR